VHKLYFKAIGFLVLLWPVLGLAQDYVDILKVGYGDTFNNTFEGSNGSTHVSVLEADLTFPIVLNDNHALITGIIFSKNRLQLYPSENGQEVPYTSLYSNTLKLGINSTFNEKWSMTVVLLPKLASDYYSISKNDFFLGGLGVLKMQKRGNIIYRFGIYSSSEAFGFYTTPIIGWYSLSKNKKFEMDMLLPISADINYTQGHFTYGFSYFGIGRSFNLEQDNSNQYVQLSSLEFAGYIQFNNLFKNVIIRAKLGYSSDDYEVHNYGDKIGFGFIAFNFDDNRVQLNPKINGSAYLKLELVYRFQIPSND
jgi:hypothetical protein